MHFSLDLRQPVAHRHYEEEHHNHNEEIGDKEHDE
jgi:hypothetical protein